MSKIVSIFESAKPAEKGFSPEEIEQHKAAFLRRGGKILVLGHGDSSPKGCDPNGYAARREKLAAKTRSRGGDDLPPEAA